ncbi:MAG: lipopolysaccharide biosynthesis protein [Steroidobacteraceae bacterium]
MTAKASNTIADFFASARTRRVPALVTAVVILLIAIVAAIAWPPTYRSTGTILIEQQEVPVDLVRSMISSYADQRIQVITQRVMSSENLMRIIDRYGLYADRRHKDTREALINGMRGDIDFRMISADVVDPRVGRPTKATIAFSVSYDNHSPVLATKVANELTTLYLNENLASRKQLSNDTASFLTDEAERVSKQIAELDAGLAAFKGKHVNNTPDLNPLNMSLMTRAEEELRETETRIRSLDQQIVYLEAQLAQLTPGSQIYTSTGERILSSPDRLKMLKSEFARASAIYAPSHPDIVRMKNEIAGLEREVGKVATGNDLVRQLEEAQSQLAVAREKYADGHPDVLRLERLAKSLQEASDAAPAVETSKEDADNPAYIQVSGQREASINERASLRQKQATLRQRIVDYELRLSQSPQIEREYSALVRDLDNAQLKYREVRQKQMEATLGQNLESERKGERFTLIEPPMLPEQPSSPNRRVILAFGLMLAVGGAIGLIALLETLDSSVRGRNDLVALLKIPPLAVVPWVVTDHERTLHAKRRRLAAAGVFASIVLAVMATHFFYRPLDVLWQVALRRLGA